MNEIDIQSIITTEQAVMLYFFNDSCAPCKILRPKVQDLVNTYFPKMVFQLIDSGQYPEETAQYGVFSSPTLLAFFEGKEYIRESKNISISELHDKIERIYNMVF